jgi:hypothetical protein
MITSNFLYFKIMIFFPNDKISMFNYKRELYLIFIEKIYSFPNDSKVTKVFFIIYRYQVNFKCIVTRLKVYLDNLLFLFFICIICNNFTIVQIKYIQI